MQRITREELWQRLDRGDQLVIVEALPKPYYRKAHLPGAINIPHTDVDALAPSMLPDPEVDIVVYCANLACENSAIAASRLTELGYQHVYDYAEGKQDWQSAGLPMENRRSGTTSGPSQPHTTALQEVSCTLDEDDRTARSETLRQELFASAEERQELEDGYAFRFPGDDRWKTSLMAFVEAERRCCSFFRIELAFEPGLGPIWLRLTGRDGVKGFIEETFDDFRENVPTPAATPTSATA